jgi:IS30 family transposase
MAKRRYRRLDPDTRRKIMRLAAKGWSERRIVDALDSSMGAVIHTMRPLGGLDRGECGMRSSGFRLTLEERVEIRIGLEVGRSIRAIAGLLGRAPSTVSREVARSGAEASIGR